MPHIRNQLSQDELSLIAKALIRSSIATRVTPIVDGLISEKEIRFGDDNFYTVEIKVSSTIKERNNKEGIYNFTMILTSSLAPHEYEIFTASELFADPSIIKRKFLSESENMKLITSWSCFCGYIREENQHLHNIMKN